MYGIAVSALDSQLDDPSSQPVNVLVKIPSLKKESQGTSAPFEFGTRGLCIVRVVNTLEHFSHILPLMPIPLAAKEKSLRRSII